MIVTMRIAVAQTRGTTLGQWPRTLERFDMLVGEARQCRADLLVLPECYWPTYVLESPQQYFAARDAGLPPPGEFLKRVGDRAADVGIAICAGLIEERDGQIANSAAFFDPGHAARRTLASSAVASRSVPQSGTPPVQGRQIAVHRKCFLWDRDNVCFQRGDAIQPFDTEFGRIGIMICADARLPEIAATLVARGARLILQPTAWVNAGTPENLWNPQPEFMIRSRAREFGVPIASASKFGPEGPETFVGCSLICDAAGAVLAQCGKDQTEVIVADVKLPDAGRTQVHAEERDVLLSGAKHVPGRSGRSSASLRIATTTRPDVPPLHVCLGEHRAGPPAAEPCVVIPVPGAAGDASRRMKAVAGAVVLSGPRDDPVELGPVRDARSEQSRDRKGAVRHAEAGSLASMLAAALPAEALSRFAPLRVLALRGVRVAFIFGRADEADLRTRAAENRLFVISVDSQRVRAVDPRGQIIHEHAWQDGSARWTLDAARAADKEFAPQTNCITGRTPDLYDF
jgi:predicted amidohydrolase